MVALAPFVDEVDEVARNSLREEELSGPEGQALGRLAQADPFLEPNKDFIFLARFDGVRSNAEGDEVAVISIVSYFQPNALLIE